MIKPKAGSSRRPAFTLPLAACDAHCHVFGPAARFPYAPERRYTPDDAPKEALIALHDQLGLSRAVIVQASCHGSDNTAMLDCLRSDPTRFRGVAILNGGETDRMLDDLTEAGVFGVRFNFVKHLGGAPDKQVFARILDRVASRGWHVVLHLDAPDIEDLSPVIKALKLPAIIDHMGRCPTAHGIEQKPFQALLKLAQRDTIWIKVSGAERIAAPPFVSAIPFAKALMQAAPDRVMWGTDFPHPNLKHEVDEVDLVDMLPHYGDAEALQRLLVDNPARLYRFKGATA